MSLGEWNRDAVGALHVSCLCSICHSISNESNLACQDSSATHSPRRLCCHCYPHPKLSLKPPLYCTAPSPLSLCCASPFMRVSVSSQSSFSREPTDAQTSRWLESIAVIRKVMREEGVRGFYRGLTASYAGMVETATHLVLYEEFKRRIASSSTDEAPSSMTWATTAFLSAGSAKSIASMSCYPHEVIRTRMREPFAPGQRKYHGLFQTLRVRHAFA